MGTQYVNTCFFLYLRVLWMLLGWFLLLVSPLMEVSGCIIPRGGVNLAGDGGGLPPIFIFLIFLFSPKFHLWPHPFFSLSLPPSSFLFQAPPLPFPFFSPRHTLFIIPVVFIKPNLCFSDFFFSQGWRFGGFWGLRYRFYLLCLFVNFVNVSFSLYIFKYIYYHTYICMYIYIYIYMCGYRDMCIIGIVCVLFIRTARVVAAVSVLSDICLWGTGALGRKCARLLFCRCLPLTGLCGGSFRARTRTCSVACRMRIWITAASASGTTGKTGRDWSCCPYLYTD